MIVNFQYGRRFSVWSALKAALALSAVAALISIALFFLQLRKTSAQLAQSLVAVQKNLDDIKVMTNSALYQAEEVLHHTDELVATETRAQTKQLGQVSTLLTKIQTTVDGLNQSQLAITASTTKALDGLPPLTTQLQATLAETEKTVAKTGEAVTSLSKLEESLEPTVQHVNGTTAHFESISSSLDTVVKNATAPKPWYKKAWGYIWDPIKLAATFAR